MYNPQCEDLRDKISDEIARYSNHIVCMCHKKHTRRHACRNMCCVHVCVVMGRVWNIKTGEMINTLIHHCEAVLHLKFWEGIMVTCSKVDQRIQQEIAFLLYTNIIIHNVTQYDFKFLLYRVTQ